MRSLPLLLVVAAALLAPAQALAGGGSTSMTDRYFEITGLVLGDQKIDASGKMAIQGGQLMASVGCNSIGGTVSVDGDVVAITQPLIQTEMACQGVAMDTEAALVKILQRGPFRISATSWDGDGAGILVKEFAAPDPGRTLPPDQPVGSSPGPIVNDPTASCAPTMIDPGFTGGSSGSGGATGSGGGSTGVGTAPSAGSGSSEGNTGSGSTSGENPTETAVAEPAGTAIAAPGEVPPATPATEPGGGPDPNATPGLDEGPAPSLVIAPEPSGVIVAPDPGTPTDPIGVDPGKGKPPIDLDPCARSYANDVTSGAGTGGGAVPPQDAMAAGEHEKAALGLDSMTLLPAAAGGLLLVLAVVGVFAARRWRATRTATPLGTEADVSR